MPHLSRQHGVLDPATCVSKIYINLLLSRTFTPATGHIAARLARVTTKATASAGATAVPKKRARSKPAPPKVTRGGHVATGTSADRRAKTAAGGTNKSAATRQAIVDAGHKVFSDVGYFDARVTDIVSAADLAHGSFYTYFPSKREVFQEVAHQVRELIQEAVSHRAEDVPGEVLANLERANRRYVRVHREHARIMTLVDQVATADPEIHLERVEARRQHVERIEKTILRLQERGIADRELDAHAVGGALVSMLSSYTQWTVLEDENYDEDSVVRTVTQIWVRATGLSEMTDVSDGHTKKTAIKPRAARADRKVRTGSSEALASA